MDHNLGTETTQQGTQQFDNMAETAPKPDSWGTLISTSTDTTSQYNISNVELRGSQMTIGRNPHVCNVVLDHPGISGVHCIISPHTQEKGCFVVVDKSTNGTFVDGQRVGKGKSTVVPTGTEIAVLRTNETRISYILKSPFNEENERNSQYSQAMKSNGGNAGGNNEQTSFLSRFLVRHVIGEGAYAAVKLAIDKKTQRRYALKEIDRSKSILRKTDDGTSNAVIEEVRILQQLDHCGVIRVHDVWETPKLICILLEYAEGGDLLDYLIKRNAPFSEEAAKDIFVQLIEAVDYLHKRRIVHRDLKPENVLVLHKPSDDDIDRDLPPLGASKLRIKLTDFGLSRITDENQYLKTICGTPQYLAPEVLRMSLMCIGYSEYTQPGQGVGYDKSVDLWSIGAILFILLTLQQPFDESHLVQHIVKGIYTFPERFERILSKEAKDVVQGLLTVDPAARLTTAQVRQHPWARELFKEREEWMRKRKEERTNRETLSLAGKDVNSLLGDDNSLGNGSQSGKNAGSGRLEASSHSSLMTDGSGVVETGKRDRDMADDRDGVKRARGE